MATDRRSKFWVSVRPIRKWKVQGGSNMTGNGLCVRLYKSVPVIFEPPCIIKHSGHTKHGSGDNLQDGASIAGILNLFRVPRTPLRVWCNLRTPFSEKVYMNE